jgi:CarD family transcriptional regulator
MEIGDAVLHPRYGVGIIESVEKRLVDGVDRDYYVIPKPSISSTVFVPVDTAGELGLRLLSTAEKLKQAVSILSGETDDTNSYTKEHRINWGVPVNLARIIRSCIVPRFPKVAQKKDIEHAKKLLAEELSAVLGMSEESIATLIDAKTTLTLR